MPTVTECLLVGAGGFAGAITRFLVTAGTTALWRTPFPAATFLVNVSGSLLIGVAGTLASRRLAGAPDALRLAFAVGFLGAYTTFSAFSLETDAMIRDGRTALALGYVAASVVVGLLAVRAGADLARALP